MGKPLNLTLKKGLQSDASTLVVYAAKDKKSGKPVSAKLAPGLQSLLDSAHKDVSFSGDKKESLFFRRVDVEGYTNVLLVGLGVQPDGENLRVAGATTVGALKAHKLTSATLFGDSLLKSSRDSAAAMQAFTEGVQLATYDFDDLKTKGKKEKKPELTDLTFAFTNAPTAVLNKAVQRANILAECQNFARWLGDSPGNYMTPTKLADSAVKAAKGTGLKVTVWDEARIKKEKFGGLMFVAQGSDEPPRFIILEYKGAAASQKPVCFVGKGLTFDTGGISIIATLLAIAKLKLKVNVIGLVPSTENMPGPRASKPGDVYFGRNGKSVEVFNTDAEGRLILSDALAYGTEQKPAVMLDVAT
ncbi:MAG TPA: leucyl aminopeptidase family protein, partial [Bdellovibrionales bacterium]|nr:leucyl aminopeptidase family protein [Bdellovibrionales bacterium]